MSYSYENTQEQSSSEVHIDASKSSLQGGENIETFAWKVIARLHQILDWFNGIAETVTVKQAVNSNYADRLTNNAGGTTKPVYFTSGQPAECGDTLNVSITGNAATATSAAACTGNAATATSATTAATCTGNAATATTAAACTGNSATATKATYDSSGNNIASLLSNCKITDYNNSYVRFGNGLKICWGDYGGGVSRGTITFPIAFNGYVYGLSIATYDGQGHEWYARISSKSTTGFTFSGSDGYSGRFSWIAIGF